MQDQNDQEKKRDSTERPTEKQEVADTTLDTGEGMDMTIGDAAKPLKKLREKREQREE